MFYCMEYLKKIYATDVPEIYGNSVIVAVEVLAETGTDLSKWATEKNLLGWLNFCPNRKISEGKLEATRY